MENLDSIKNPVMALGRYTIGFIQDMGRLALFFFKGFAHIFSLPLQIQKILQQTYFIGM